MSHTDKYLKYKNKYLELKNQVGGNDTDSLNLPDDLLHSFFKAILLFLNTISERTVKYFHLLQILEINQTYLNMHHLEQIDNFAQKIADRYNLQIFLPNYVDTTLSKMGIGNKKIKKKKDNWKKITTVNHKHDVVILINQGNDKYNLVNNELIQYNDSIHSFFKAILLFLNNYLDNNITYLNLLQIVGTPNMFSTDKYMYEEIKKYAQQIANHFKVQIEFILIINIDGKIAYHNTRDSDIAIIPTTDKPQYLVLISKDEYEKYEKYNLVTTEIQYLWEKNILYKIY